MLKKFFILLSLGIAMVLQVSAQTSLEKIQKSGELRVGMSGTQPPFSMKSKSGALIGFEVDLAEILAESMKLELKIIEMPFNELLPALEDGKIDMVMSGMTITMDRNMKAAFVGPYVLSGKSILTKMESLAKAKEVEDLNQSDLKITSLKGSTSESFVDNFLPDASSMPAANYDDALQMLLDGEANVMVADYPVCVLNVLKYPEAELVTLNEPLTIEPIGMALPAHDPLMINFMENYLNALIMSGTLSELESYWFENGSWLIEVE